jgi:Fe-S cluster assembly protein SufD
MAEALAPGTTEEAFETFLGSRREPRWLTDMRRNAWAAFRQSPMPHDLPAGPQQEEWRRTDARRLRLEKFPLPAAEATGTVPAAVAPLLAAGVDLAGQAAAIDSRPCPGRFDPDLAARGVLFGSLDELVQTHGKRIEPYLFTQAVDPFHDKFSALHAACWAG